jgi:hypothetical protein
MKVFGLSVILTGALITPVMACDLCAVYSANEARAEEGKGFFGGVAEQFTHFGTTQEEGKVVPNPTGQYLDSSISQLFAGYKFNDQFGFQLNVPIIYRSFKRPEGFEIQHGTVSGLGDISVLGNFVPYRYMGDDFSFNWLLDAGLKLPSGSASRLKEEFVEEEIPGAPISGIHGHDLTLGTGSVDGIIGTSIGTRWKRLFFTASTQYAIRSEGSFDYRFANDLTWWGGPGVTLALNPHYTLALQAVVSGETKGKDTFQGEKAEDTGVTSVYLGPQINFTWTDKFSAQVGVDVPVSIQNTSFQTVPDYRVRAGLTWRF